MKKLNILFVLILLICACGKEYLEIKRNQNDAIPATIKDYQAMMDNSQKLMNANSCHELGLLAADEFVVSDEVWKSLTAPYQKNGYIWGEDVYEKQPVKDWDQAYRRVLQSNIVLDGIEKIKPVAAEIQLWNNVKGSALFFRSLNFYQLAQQFCKPYSSNAAAIEPGIPLRLEADITLKSSRATIEATYQQIIQDIKESVDLLPITPVVKERPSKPAAYALLTRIYLQMENYNEALYYADLCLQLKHELIDFNSIDVDRDTYNTFDLIKANNPEVIFVTNVGSMVISSYGRFNVDTELLGSYSESDLRKKAYFRSYQNTNIFKGSYLGNGLFFTGLAVDEVLLARAECYARLKDASNALDDLNYLLRNRYDNENFTELSSDNPDEILGWIIEERRKELVLRGTRWEDLRRLNKDSRFARQLVKIIDGQRYELARGSLKYTWPLPDNVIQQSGMEQNLR